MWHKVTVDDDDGPEGDGDEGDDDDGGDDFDDVDADDFDKCDDNEHRDWTIQGSPSKNMLE